MGTPVDFWSLEDCVKALSELGDSREASVVKAEAVGSAGVPPEAARSSMSGYSQSEDAIRQLLAEKERDLELAAQIGSRLLEQNKELERRLETLDTQLLSANDRAQQLRHELSQKEQLVQVYSRICEEAQGDDLWSSHTPTHVSPQHQPSPNHSSTPSCASDVFSPRTSRRGVLSTGLDQLQTQICQLEEENNRLRHEHDLLSAVKKEKEDKSVVEDCLRQLSDANNYIRNLSEDLTKKTDKFMERQDEVTDLFERSLQMEQRVKDLTGENRFLNSRLQEAQTSQFSLTDQLGDLRDKYDQCLLMLTDAHTEIRRVQFTHSPVRPLTTAPPPTSPARTLAAELHESLLAEVEEDEAQSLPAVASFCALPSEPASQPGLRRSSYPWDLRPNRGGDDESTSASSMSSSEGEGEAGAVGGDRLRRVKSGRHSRKKRGAVRRPHLPTLPQTGAEARWSPGGQPLQDKEKYRSSRLLQVQMVKSMEGSTTLRQWQRLARPSMSGALFERRPGVRVRGCSGNRMSGGGGLGGLGGLLSDDSEEEESRASDSEEKAIPVPIVREKERELSAFRKPEKALPVIRKPELAKDVPIIKRQKEKKEEGGRVMFGLGGLGMESATTETSPKHRPKSMMAKDEPEEEEEEELRAEVEAITFRMSSAPPDPARNLDSFNQRRAAAEKNPSLTKQAGNKSPSLISSTTSLDSKAVDKPKPLALSHHGFSASNLAAILNEKGIRSKTYEQLVGEGFPVPPSNQEPAQPAPVYPSTPRNSPTDEVESRFVRERTPGPVNPTLVLTGLMESLSELFKPIANLSASTVSLREEPQGGGLRRNWSGSKLDGGLNAVSESGSAVIPSVLHRTDTSAASPRRQ